MVSCTIFHDKKSTTHTDIYAILCLCECNVSTYICMYIQWTPFPCRHTYPHQSTSQNDHTVSYTLNDWTWQLKGKQLLVHGHCSREVNVLLNVMKQKWHLKVLSISMKKLFKDVLHSLKLIDKVPMSWRWQLCMSLREITTKGWHLRDSLPILFCSWSFYWRH